MASHTAVVVLDPGHGGSAEAGGSSPNNTSGGGLLEKDVTLDIARRVRERLARRATVLLTRDSDTNLSLAERAAFARAMSADVFVSLHCNGHVDPAADTTEVYVRRGGDPRQAAFARELHRSVAQATGSSAGGVIEADLGVLLADRHAPGTVAALAELFDLTNPARVEQAATVPFLDLVATAVADAVAGALETPVALSRPTARTRRADGRAPSRGAARALSNGARALSDGVAPAWVRGPEVERAAAALRERGVADHDIQLFLSELEGRGTVAASLGLPRGRTLEDGRSTVELPPAHLFEWWQEELIAAALSTTPLGVALPALRAISDTYGVTIGIGPAVAGGVAIGLGFEAGLVIAPGYRLGFYGTVSALLGALVSISLTMAVTVVYGGPSVFSGSMLSVGVTVDTGVGVGVAAHALLSPSTGGMVGITGEIGVSAGLSPFEAFARYQYTATTLGVPAVRAQSTEQQVQQVLDHIKAEAARRAAAGIAVPATSAFLSVLRSRYLSDYLAAPGPATGRAAVTAIGAQNTSGVATPVCGVLDFWENATPQFNDSPIPAWLRNLPGMGDLPENFGAATEIITVANRGSLGYVDLPFLLGRHTLNELDCADRRAHVADADLQSDNGMNTSQLMHWATGVRFGAVPQGLLRDLFLGYELWHLELLDVFGHDPVNDLIVEDAGRHLAGLLLSGAVSAADLDARVAEGFRQARAWVGGLLDRRRDQLDAQITAMEPPEARIHWIQQIGPDDQQHPYRSPSIRRMLTDGRTVTEVKQTRLVEDYIAVYTLIFEAAAAPPELSVLQRLGADGSLDGVFRAGAEAAAGRPISLVGAGLLPTSAGLPSAAAGWVRAQEDVPAAPGSSALVGVFGQKPWGYLFVPVAEMVPGIDVSHHQGQIDWAQVAAAGKGFAYIKATEGATWKDGRFATNWAGALAAGVPRGAYHLLKRPTSSAVAAQVENFLNTVTIQPGDLPPALDVEYDDLVEIIADLGVAGAWRHLWDWCEEVELATGYRPLLYLSQRGGDELRGNLGSLPALDLWMPRYRATTDLPPLPEDAAGELPFPHWQIWQHSETGAVPGITGNVDLNLFNGNPANFASWLASAQPRSDE